MENWVIGCVPCGSALSTAGTCAGSSDRLRSSSDSASTCSLLGTCTHEEANNRGMLYDAGPLSHPAAHASICSAQEVFLMPRFCTADHLTAQ